MYEFCKMDIRLSSICKRIHFHLSHDDEAVSTSETSVNFYETTRRNIPEDNHVHTHHRANVSLTQIFMFAITSTPVLRSAHTQ
jgi:hypothetical protein